MQTIKANQLELTKADLATIAEIYELTKVTTPEGELPGIITFKGPETAKLFGPRNGAVRWASIPPLGETRDGPCPPGEMPESRRFRRVERLFQGSKRWPEGIPVGWYDVHKRKTIDGDEYKYEANAKDISTDEEKRLYSLAWNKRRMTPQERLADTERKQAVRAARESPDMASTMAMLQQMFGIAAAQAQTAANTVEEPVKAGK